MKEELPASIITDYKQLEAALQSSRRRYRMLFEHNLAGVFLFTLEGRIVDCNDAYAKMAGYESREEFFGLAPAELYLDVENRTAYLERVQKEGEITRLEYRLLTKDGRDVWVVGSAHVIEGEDGTPLVQGTAIDITDQKIAKEARLEAERKYRDIFENAGEGIFQTTPEGEYIAANPALARMHGFDSAAGLILSRNDISRQVYVDPLEREKFKRRLEEHGTVHGFEHEIRRADGSKLWISVNARVVRDEQGQVLYYEGTAQDITERKRSQEALRNAEQKYHTIFENAGEGIFQTTANGRFITANRALAQMLGFISPEDLMLNVTNLERHYVDPERRREFERLLQANDSLRNFEYQVFRKDGSTIWISDNARTVRDESGALLYYEGCARDITNRKEAEGELIKQKEILQKIFDYTPMMITFIGADGRTRLVNREWERTLGWSLEEVTQGNLDVFAELYPDPTYRAEVLRYIAAGSTEWADFKTRIRDGQIIDTTWANVLLSDGTSIGIGKDITARKQAEEALQQSEERYRDLVENSEELICTHDMEGRILSANRAAAIALGQPKDYAVERNLRDILAPEVGSDEFEDYLSRLQEEGFAKGMMLIQTSTGERRIWEYYNTLRMEGVATPIVRGMAHDITERKRSEKEREVISEVIESVSLTTNLDQLLKLVHQALKKVVYAENCFVALYDKETGLFSQPFYIDQARSACPPPRELKKSFAAYVFRTGLPYLQTVGKSETLIAQGEVELNEPAAKAWLGVPLKTPAATIGVLVVQHYERADAYNNRDLEFLSSVGAELALAIERKRTEAALRESEERYRGLFENAKDAIYVHDLNGTYTSVNRAAEKLSGYSRTQIIGKSFAAFVAPEHLHQVRENMWKKLSDHGETSYEMDFIARNGSRVPVEVSSRLIYENGTAVGVQGMARDITERKRAREASQAFSRRLIEAQEGERQRIARELHDQIGQILTAVQFNLQFIQGLCKEPDCHPHIEDSLRVLDEALDQVRDLSFELRPSMLDDLGLVPALRWYVSRQARLTGLRIEFLTELPAHSLRFGLELETACFRIAQEAVTNVARHAHSKRVSVQIQRVAGDLRLIIKDDGLGFDVDALSQRASGATLGLQGMQERAFAVGGTIEIDSAVAKGTTVRASFPIKLN
jgi:PAS domain S-box-containing protein